MSALNVGSRVMTRQFSAGEPTADPARPVKVRNRRASNPGRTRHHQLPPTHIVAVTPAMQAMGTHPRPRPLQLQVHTGSRLATQIQIHIRRRTERHHTADMARERTQREHMAMEGPSRLILIPPTCPLLASAPMLPVTKDCSGDKAIQILI
jgi:hypothetical protein